MDKNIKKEILNCLFKERRAVYINDVILSLDYLFPSTSGDVPNINQINQNKKKILHVIEVLVGQNLIHRKANEDGRCWWDEISLTATGYREFNPWYKKLWSFVNNDFAKLLSLISIILSIIATFISLRK